MFAYTLKRILLMIPVLFGVTLIVFFSIRLVPGDALVSLMETALMDKADMARLRHNMGLDVPVYVQYFRWIGGLAHGDLGLSLATNEPVLERLAKAIPITAELAFLTMLFTTVIGIFVGVLSAVMRNTWVDHVARIISVAALSIPSFVIATLVIALPALWWHYYPDAVYQQLWDDPIGNIQQMIPAALSLGAAISAISMRMMRSMMLEVIGEDYMRTAGAKGLREWVRLRRHALPNALPPVLSVLGQQFGYLLGGSVIIENIFQFPGVGQMTVDAINHRDYTQIQGNILLIALAYLVVNLLVDLAYAWLDPRIRYA